MNKITLVIATIALILSICALAVASTKTVKIFGGTTAGSWIAGEDLQAGDDCIVGDDLTVSGLATIGETLAVTGKSTFTGDVGIATTTPGSELDVYDATATSSIAVYSGGAGKGGWIILENNSGAGCFAIGVDANGGWATSSVTCGGSY